jgi:hypothetical protein
VGPITPRLTVENSTDLRYHLVRVAGQVPSTTRAEAQSLKDNGYKIVLRLWGDDPSYDDLLRGPWNPESFYVTNQGLTFFSRVKVSNATLDEDWDQAYPYIRDQDELYVGVRLVNSAGTTIMSKETNRVNDHY